MGNFVPNMILIGPSISPEGTLPSNIEVPEGTDAVVIPGKFPDKPFYEPFTPAKSYELADIDMRAPSTGEYYVAVYSPETVGKYSFVIGYQETFSLLEWIKVPIDVIGIHLWEGQSILFILAPLITTLAIGLILATGSGISLFSASGAGVLAGLIYIGSGFMTLMQMTIALIGPQLNASFIITLIIVLISILLGVGILKITLKEQFTTSNRVMLVGIGILGLFTWAGLLVGPVIAIAAALIPSKR